MMSLMDHSLQTIDFIERQGRRIGKHLVLTNGEFRLLEYILSVRGKVLSRKRIVALIRSSFSFTDRAAVEIQLDTLRRKIELDPAKPEFVL